MTVTASSRHEAHVARSLLSFVHAACRRTLHGTRGTSLPLSIGPMLAFAVVFLTNAPHARLCQNLRRGRRCRPPPVSPVTAAPAHSAAAGLDLSLRFVAVCTVTAAGAFFQRHPVLRPSGPSLPFAATAAARCHALRVSGLPSPPQAGRACAGLRDFQAVTAGCTGRRWSTRALKVPVDTTASKAGSA